jgi:uncharacterized protein (DUF305 family)
VRKDFMSCGFPTIALALLSMSSVAASCQQGQPASGGVSIVQPGAPGHSNKTLPPDTVIAARPPSEADVKFMQGMIMHHSQAVEMTALLRTHGQDKDLQELGQRISISQTDEMKFMKRWLTDRGYPITDPADDMGGMDMADMDMPMMPGMLTKQQMKALAAANGPAFDHLFLTGMIQHHTGALIMVKELFASSPGAGQDPLLFDFASDVDNTQQAEIDIMQHMLKKEKQ